jgi:hypothetical protein
MRAGRTFVAAVLGVSVGFGAAEAAVPPAPAIRSPTVADLEKLHRLAQCMVAERHGAIVKLLRLDPNDPGYETLLRVRAESSGSCIKSNGSLRFGGVALAGVLAERLIESGHVDLSTVTRIEEPPVVSRSPSETMALCTVKAQPGQVTALLATTPGTPGEMTVIRMITPALGDCLTSGVQANLNATGLRSVLALAAFRLADRPIAGGVK